MVLVDEQGWVSKILVAEPELSLGVRVGVGVEIAHSFQIQLV